MGRSFDTIRFRAEACDACGQCVIACARAKTGTDDTSRARLQILGGGTEGAELALCRQCTDPQCAAVCPSASLAKDPDSGVVTWEAETCVDCLLCTVGCAYGGIASDPVAGHVAKCDLCDGAPECVAACDRGALEHVTASRLYNTQHEREDLFAPGLSACHGCNSELLIRHTMRHIGRETVVAAPPGCIPGMGVVGYNGQTGCKVPVFHPLLTNTAAMLAGLKTQYARAGRDVTMVALAGDGGTVDVGFQSLSGAAARNDPMLFICVDNEGYMNTGMQASGSTSYGSWTSTTPVGEHMQGKSGDAKSLPMLMMMHNGAYVATASTAFLEDYHEKLEKAYATAQHGFAYLHVYAPCPTGWRFPAALTTEVCRRQVETNFVTLWEYTRDGGLRFTRPVEGRRPIGDYVDMIGKYRHLDRAQRDVIQHQVDERVAFLRRFAAPDGG